MRFHPFRHFGLKIVSVVLAVLLWLIVSTQRSPVERGMRIPLELQNLPSNLEMVDAPEEAVNVRMRGSADTLAKLTPGDVVASIDLSSAQPGRRLFHIGPDRVRAPFNVEVTQVTPATIALRFESSASRSVPVHPAVQGDPAAGYIVGELAVEPKTIEVVGPESAIRRVAEVITEPVWVGDAKATVKATVSMGVAEPGVRVKAARGAQVQVEIVPAPAERSLSVPVRIRNLADGLSAVVEPSTIKLRARGTTAAIEKLKTVPPVAYVDLEGISEGDYGFPVRVDRIPGLGVDQIEPAVVRIHVQ